MTSFSDLGVPQPVVKAMTKMGWTDPTPVQIAAIPVGLKGGDMFAQAQTGTGKTGTYASIILGRIETGFKPPSALVLTPTRELALQVSGELTKLTEFTDHISLPIYGGVSITPQASKLRKGCDIVVGTPGRLKDLIDRGDLDLSWVSIVVLDEADRMLDMGFSRDLEYILARVPKKRQTLMFSATMSPDIKRLAKNHMKDPTELLVSKDEPVLDLISQYYMVTDKDSKRNILCDILDNGNPRTIAFCHTKRKSSQVAKKMINEGYIAAALHGDVPQAKREKIITSFKSGSIDLLIATDVAARGLDIDDVDYVVNYDMPDVPETYVHRIGRVGRAGKTGIAVSFVLPEELSMIKDIQKLTGKKIEPFENAPQAQDIFKDPEEKNKARVAMIEAKAAAKESETAAPEPIAEPQSKKGVSQQRKVIKNLPPVSVQFNIGITDGLSKNDLCNLIIADSEVLAQDIGSIVIGSKTAYVEIKGADAKKMAKDLTGKYYKDRELSVKLI